MLIRVQNKSIFHMVSDGGWLDPTGHAFDTIPIEKPLILSLFFCLNQITINYFFFFFYIHSISLFVYTVCKDLLKNNSGCAFYFCI